MRLPVLHAAYSSVQGPSHRAKTPPVPCQDAGIARIMANGMYVLIASDGAGSSMHAEKASGLCVTHLTDQIEKQQDQISGIFKTENPGKEWASLSKSLFESTRKALISMGVEKQFALQDLNCTLLVTILTEGGFLTAHIGDGRAGFANPEPKALLTPFQCFVAGATYFLMKDGWEAIFRSYVTPLDSATVSYFFMSTDGCQSYIIQHDAPRPETGPFDEVLGDEAFYDGNLPYTPFFTGLIASLKEEPDQVLRNQRLEKLLDQGKYQLNGEEKVLQSLIDPRLDDDKTLLLFYL